MSTVEDIIYALQNSKDSTITSQFVTLDFKIIMRIINGIE